jgi:hypothetical protein
VLACQTLSVLLTVFCLTELFFCFLPIIHHIDTTYLPPGVKVMRMMMTTMTMMRMIMMMMMMMVVVMVLLLLLLLLMMMMMMMMTLPAGRAQRRGGAGRSPLAHPHHPRGEAPSQPTHQSRTTHSPDDWVLHTRDHYWVLHTIHSDSVVHTRDCDWVPHILESDSVLHTCSGGGDRGAVAGGVPVPAAPPLHILLYRGGGRGRRRVVGG